MTRHAGLIVAGLLAVALPGSASAEPRAVVELFTSQGCSSCPPADRVLGELAQDSSIIALSVPVDYWDYLGWKDSLASPKHTARQWAYSRMRGERGVYTPQVVVNGALQALGSDKSAIRSAIARSQGKTMILPVTLTASGDKLTVKVAENKEVQGPAEVWLCGVSKAVPVAIGRGENRGRTVTYVNVARNWVKLGDWNGKAASWTVPASAIQTEGVDSAAVIVQNGSPDKPGPILGAALAGVR